MNKIRTFKRKVSGKKGAYKKSMVSTYSNKYKWKIILPEQVYIKLEDCITVNPPNFPFKKEVALFFLSLISSVPSFKKDKYYSGGYVNLKSEILKKYNRNYKKYFDYFKSNYIIDINPSFSNFKDNKFCKGFCYDYENLGNLTFKIIELENLKGSFYNKLFKLNPSICDGTEYLTKWINEKLKIDIESTMPEIQMKLKYVSTEEQKNFKKSEHYLQSLANLDSQSFWAKRSNESDNRLHTNLTNMPKFFRKYIIYDGEGLIGLDIKNSQPFFLILLIEALKSAKLKEKNRERERGKKNERKEEIINSIYGNTGTMLHVLQDSLYSKEFQKEYLDIKANILKGAFYESLAPHFEFQKNTKGKYQRKFYCEDSKKMRMYFFDEKRDVLKRLVLFFFYKSNKTQSDVDYKKFKSLYPNFCEVLELLKEKDNKLLPKVLQHLEADCVLDYTCKEIAKKYPEMPLFTIHDSIITTESNFDVLESEVKNLMEIYCNGIEPILKREDWCEECSSMVA
mgnify:CR=1 FL=1